MQLNANYYKWNEINNRFPVFSTTCHRSIHHRRSKQFTNIYLKKLIKNSHDSSNVLIAFVSIPNRLSQQTCIIATSNENSWQVIRINGLSLRWTSLNSHKPLKVQIRQEMSSRPTLAIIHNSLHKKIKQIIKYFVSLTKLVHLLSLAFIKSS